MKKILILMSFLFCASLFSQNNTDKIDSLFKLIEKQDLKILNLNSKNETSIVSLNQKIKLLTEEIQLLQDSIELLSNHIIILNNNFKNDNILIDKEIKSNRILLEDLDNRLDDELSALNNELSTQEEALSFNQEEVKKNDSDITNIESLLDEKELEIANITSTLDEKGIEITDIKSTISKKQLLWMIIVLFILTMAIIAYLLLNKRMNKNKKDIHEKMIENDQKLADFLEGFTKDLKVSDKEENHEVAIKTASELTKMGNNLNMMDSSIPGHKRLLRSKQKIEDYLKINGYEIKTYLNQDYNDDMNVTANTIEDENLDKGVRIVTKCTKPQINYKGKLIQTAEIEVSEGV